MSSGAGGGVEGAMGVTLCGAAAGHALKTANEMCVDELCCEKRQSQSFPCKTQAAVSLCQALDWQVTCTSTMFSTESVLLTAGLALPRDEQERSSSHTWLL